MANDQTKAYNVFLSHAHVDAEVVEKLAAALEDEHHLRVWLDRWVLVPGANWQQGISKGLDEAASCAVCIGNGEVRGWFKEEIERALNRQTKDQNFRVIPVILPGGDLNMVEQFLELHTWVEFKRGIADPEALRVLRAGILGVAPGRPSGSLDQEDQVVQKKVTHDLAGIRDLLDKRLIHEQIALEFQRQIVDRMINASR